MKTKFTFPYVLVAAILFGITKLAGQNLISTTVVTQPCNNNGQVNVSVIGLTPPISYTFSNWYANQNIIQLSINSTTSSISGLPGYNYLNSWTNPNVWSIIASDGTNVISGGFTLVPSFSFNDTVLVATCPALCTVAVTSFSGGVSPYTAIWTKKSNMATYIGTTVQVPNGTYSVAVSDASGCLVYSLPDSINVMSNSNIVLTTSGSNANCTNGTATVSAAGGTTPYSFLWSNNAVTQSLSGLTQGQYSCLVTDALGCQALAFHFVPQAITFSFNTVINNATCSQNNGSVTSFVSGGAAPYTFLWTGGATTQNLLGVTSGQYVVQITDANGCTGTGFAFVGSSTPVNATFTTSPSACTMATGAATVQATGGVAPYTTLWYTSPVVTGSVISNKAPGTYQFKITDANGCIRTGAVVIPNISNISGTITASTAICPATTGNVYAQVFSGAPPYSYLWSTSATTSSLSNVPLGIYTCTITDAAGCSIVKSAAVNQISLLSVGYSATVATCKFSSNGMVTANASGGTPPYSYTWTTNQTGATITGLAAGYYKAVATDANGCTSNVSNWAYVGFNPNNNSCYCTITGVVYNDLNTNCVRNTGEAGISAVQIQINGFGSVFTNINGAYNVQVPSGSYTVTQSVQPHYPLAPCQNSSQTLTLTASSGCSVTVNFANTVTPVHDLRIITSNLNLPVPGNTYLQRVLVFNDGTTNQNNIKLGYVHDGQLNFNSATAWNPIQQNTVTAPNWYSVLSGFPILQPNTSAVSDFLYNVPTNIPVGTGVNFKDTVARLAPTSTGWLQDVSPWNNVNQHQAIVVGSYDPNFKEVFPKGEGSQGDITVNDSLLTYVVHFQNTGSYYAQNVVVVDSIDQSLDIRTMKPGFSDKKFVLEIDNNNVARFIFTNINLPWKSQFGDLASSAMFTYSIKQKKNLPLGTQIKNKAAIYFDYNAPIITNTTLNTLVMPSSVDKTTANNTQSSLKVYPNPTAGSFEIVVEAEKRKSALVSIFDLQGKEVAVATVNLEQGLNQFSASGNELPNGVYIVKLIAQNQQLTAKLVIAR